jgi:hypothetical protein
VDQYRLLPGLLVGELEGRARLHFGLLGDGFATLYLGDPAARALRRLPGSFDGAGSLAFFARLIVAAAAGRDQRSAGGANPQGRPEPDELYARETLLGQNNLLDDCSRSSPPHSYTADVSRYTQGRQFRFFVL